MDFKKINFKDKSFLEKHLSFVNTNSYEYTFFSLYFWKSLYDTDFSLIDNSLIIRKHCRDDLFNFMMPISLNYDNLPFIIDELKYISKNSNTPLVLCDIDDSFLSILKNKFDILYSLDRDSFEYIYPTSNLINLCGKKYHKKKNHYNTFIKNNLYSIYKIDTPEIINDCLNLLDFSLKNKSILSKELEVEKCATEDIIYNLDYLNAKSIAIYVDDMLAGFSIGELFNDTAIIHIEKCDKNFNGIYSFINQKFLLEYFSQSTWVNRQEDCGDLGLRRSKLSYHPDHFIKKYKVVIL